MVLNEADLIVQAWKKWRRIDNIIPLGILKPAVYITDRLHKQAIDIQSDHPWAYTNIINLPDNFTVLTANMGSFVSSSKDKTNIVQAKCELQAYGRK